RNIAISQSVLDMLSIIYHVTCESRACFTLSDILHILSIPNWRIDILDEAGRFLECVQFAMRRDCNQFWPQNCIEAARSRGDGCVCSLGVNLLGRRHASANALHTRQQIV